MTPFDTLAALFDKPTTRPRRVAVTGHCNLGDAAPFVAASFAELLAALRSDAATPTAISGLAAGADTVFAEAALALGLPLEGALAADDLIENFAPGVERERYLGLLERCARVHCLPFPTRSNGAYMALGYLVVDSCDLLLAAWNGRPAAALGGTGDVVAYARAVGRPVVHLHTLERRVTLLPTT